jgi:hypothetical protein
MKKRQIVYSLFLIFGASSLTLFQNCGRTSVGFESTSSKALSVNDGPHISLPPVSLPPVSLPLVVDPVPSAIARPIACASPKQMLGQSCLCPADTIEVPDVGCISKVCNVGSTFNMTTHHCDAAPTCAANYAYDGHSCVLQSTQCSSYVEIKDDQFVLPAKINNVCYYVKLVDQYDLSPSGNLKRYRDGIVSRNHDGVGNRAPGIIGDRKIIFKLPADSQWSVVLGGDTHGEKEMAVDNYFLAEISSASAKLPVLWAAGTEDAIPQSGPITVDGQALTDFHIHGTSATSRFQPEDITSKIVKGESIEFHGSALDCGGVAGSTDIYLIFR